MAAVGPCGAGAPFGAGRAHMRTVLYMGTLVATRFHPQIKAIYRTFRTPLEPLDSILVVFRSMCSIKKIFHKFKGLCEWVRDVRFINDCSLQGKSKKSL
jgi:hypothetical protein